MKLFNNFLILSVLFSFFSCQKNVVEYNTETVGDVAEYQLHYFVPVAAVDSNAIFKVVVDGKEYVNGSFSGTTFRPAIVLAAYNAVPSGSVGRFYTTKIGQNNIKLYASDKNKLVYDQDATLKKGKQNIFVYDFKKPPIVFDNGFPYQTNVTENTDSTAWIKFYNFLYENTTTPTSSKLQYQYQYTTDNTAGTKSNWINIGSPVSFGETTGWQAVKVNKSVQLSESYARLDYKIKIIGADGTDQGDLLVINASNNFVNYSDFWTAYVGRRYHHILSGIRTTAPRAAVRQFTAL